MFDHSSDVTVLENLNFALNSLDRDIHHSTRQVVGPNYQVWKRQLKRGGDGAQQVLQKSHRETGSVE